MCLDYKYCVRVYIINKQTFEKLVQGNRLPVSAQNKGSLDVSTQVVSTL